MAEDRYHFAFSWETGFGHAARLILDHAPGSTVLDLGCGYGPMAEVIAKEGGCAYVGVDIDPGGLVDLKSRGFETHLADLADFGRLPATLRSIAAGRHVGVVSMLDVIEHLQSTEGLLAGLRRVWEELGDPLLVLSLPNVTHYDIAAKLLTGRWEMSRTGLMDYTHTRFFGSDRLERLMSGFGFGGVAEFDLREDLSEQALSEPENPLLVRSSPLYSLLSSLRSASDEHAGTFQFVRAYKCDGGAVPVVDGTLECAEALALWSGPEGSPTPVGAGLATTGSRPFLSLVLVPRTGDPQGPEVRAFSDAGGEAAGEYEVVRLRGFDPGLPDRSPESFAQGLSDLLSEGVRKSRGHFVMFVPGDEPIDEAAISGMFEAVKVDGDNALSMDPKVIRIAGPGFMILEAFASNISPLWSVAIPEACFSSLGMEIGPDDVMAGAWPLVLRAQLYCGIRDVLGLKPPGGVPATHEGGEYWNAFWSGTPLTDERPAQLLARSLGAVLLPPGSPEQLSAAGDQIGSLHKRLGELENELAAAQAGKASLEAEAARLSSEVAGLSSQIREIRQSTSWKVTAPIRQVAKKAKKP